MLHSSRMCEKRLIPICATVFFSRSNISHRYLGEAFPKTKRKLSKFGLTYAYASIQCELSRTFFFFLAG